MYVHFAAHFRPKFVAEWFESTLLLLFPAFPRKLSSMLVRLNCSQLPVFQFSLLAYSCLPALCFAEPWWHILGAG
jgi:hypothetical protein